ncbi:MAG TPA: hypothetical protein VG934_03485 [Candidatus Paceibacterota bacterium]|nr:hypothetical protein [Candidatus Paceibacterota bacterium]
MVGGGVVYFLTPKYPAPAVTETAAPSELVSPPAQDAVRTVSIGPNGIAASGYDVNDVQQLAGIQQGMKWDAACGCQKPVAAPPPPVVVPKPHPRPKPKATCDDACKEYQRLKGVSVDVSKSCSYVLVRNPQPVVLKTAWGKVVTSWAQSQISWQQTSRGWLGQICAPASVYATAGPGARYCAEIAQSEMNEDERSRLMAGGTWDSNDPFCLKSQAECRADNLSWK